MFFFHMTIFGFFFLELEGLLVVQPSGVISSLLVFMKFLHPGRVSTLRCMKLNSSLNVFLQYVLYLMIDLLVPGGIAPANSLVKEIRHCELNWHHPLLYLMYKMLRNQENGCPSQNNTFYLRFYLEWDSQACQKQEPSHEQNKKTLYGNINMIL